MSSRKIAVVTGSRADYGLLYWILNEIHDDPALDLQLIITGMHLAPEFGSTWRQVRDDGFPIAAKIDMQVTADTPSAIARSMGLGTAGFGEAFETLDPDLLVLLGDRFEILCAAQAAVVARVPIAHIHGGEVTEGVFDESFRHAITKMASVHFVSAEPHRKRVIQMGEDPGQVLNYGAPGLDRLDRIELLGRDELATELNFQLGECCFLVTYHPVTLDQVPPTVAQAELFAALDAFPDCSVIMTYPNADTLGRSLIEPIERYATVNKGRVLAIPSLGQKIYLSALKLADVVIGNSSSGLIEAPSFKKATVNIGDRQKGRLQADSVINCAEGSEAIILAIKKALSDEFYKSLSIVQNPYGQGGASEKIVAKIKSIELKGLIRKPFHDLA